MGVVLLFRKGRRNEKKQSLSAVAFPPKTAFDEEGEAPTGSVGIQQETADKDEQGFAQTESGELMADRKQEIRMLRLQRERLVSSLPKSRPETIAEREIKRLDRKIADLERREGKSEE